MNISYLYPNISDSSLLPQENFQYHQNTNVQRGGRTPPRSNDSPQPNGSSSSAIAPSKLSTGPTQSEAPDKNANNHMPSGPVLARARDHTSHISPCHPGQNEVCSAKPRWHPSRFISDEYGTGFIPYYNSFRTSKKEWCGTPLSSYQATHGELGRRILCGELVIEHGVDLGPPCNICEYILPLCRDYYRKNECHGTPCGRGRDKVQRYWEPCSCKNGREHVIDFAPHNAALALEVKSKSGRTNCW